MFTGIIRGIGIIRHITNKDLTVKVNQQITKMLTRGDSVAIDGVCLTIVEIKDLALKFNLSPETYEKTTFKYLKVGDRVNVEPPLKAGEYISGHIVTGHVDTITHITNIKRVGGSHIFYFKTPIEYRHLLVKKGAVAVDGISLTVVDVNSNNFTVSIVPFTFENTNLKFKKINSKVNLEFDIISKYIRSLLKKEDD